MTGKKTPERRRLDPGRGRPLGSITKSASRYVLPEDKILKYALQSAARELAPHSRVRSCMRVTIPQREGVEVWYSDVRQTAYYRNLMRCGMVWVCPLCASMITERRTGELKKLLSAKETIPIIGDMGVERVLTVSRFHLSLGTFTVAHNARASLGHTLSILDAAYKRMWGGRWAKIWKHDHQIVGTIRALEVTLGDNGWHPHIHTLFIRRSANTSRSTFDMSVDLAFRWEDCVSSSGGVADKIHGVDYRAADTLATEYISKMGMSVIGNAARWDAISEVVKYPVKMGRRGSKTIWDLLALYMSGDVRSGELWIEAQRNLRGRRHLVASRGLYDTLGAIECMCNEQEMSQDTEHPTDILLASLTIQEWQTVIRKDMRGQLIAVASTGDRALLVDFLESLL